MNNPLSTDWGFIINAFAILLAILSVYLSVKPPWNRWLHVIYWSTFVETHKLIGKINRSKKLSGLNLTFQNMGREVIYKRDIVGKIQIALQNAEGIAGVLVESNSQYNSVDIELSKGICAFDFDFLEPKNYLKIQIAYYVDQNAGAIITGKIIGAADIHYRTTSNSYMVDEIISRKNANVQVIIFPIAILLSFLIQSEFILRCFRLDPDTVLSVLKQFDERAFLIMFIGLILSFISIRIGIAVKHFLLPFATSAKEVTKWYPKKKYKWA
jgi:hypothetical protein